MYAALEPFKKRGARMTLGHGFMLSAAVRGSALHDAIAREAEEDNPHATFVLLRSMLDLVLVVLQVRRQPSYAAVVMDVGGPERTARGPLKSQQLLANSRTELPDMKGVWDELSEAAHFGREAFVQTISEVRETDDGLLVSQTTEPGWREPEDKLVALAALALMTRILAATFMKMLDDQPLGEPLSE